MLIKILYCLTLLVLIVLFFLFLIWLYCVIMDRGYYYTDYRFYIYMNRSHFEVGVFKDLD